MAGTCCSSCPVACIKEIRHIYPDDRVVLVAGTESSESNGPEVIDPSRLLNID